MPFAIAAPLIAAAVSAGTQLAQSAMAPGPSDYARANALQTARQSSVTEHQNINALAAQTPQAAEASGGSLTPAGYESLASVLAGVPSDPFSSSTAWGQIFGASAPGTTAAPATSALAPETGPGAGTSSATSPAGAASPGGSDLMSRILERFLGNPPDMMGSEFAGSFA